MKKNRILIPLFFLLIISFSEINDAFSQPTDPQLNTMITLKNNQAEKISDWESDATLALIMVLSVGIIGAVLAFIQKFDLKHKAMITASLGLLIAIITVIDANILPDYGTLKKRVLEAKLIMGELEIELTQDVPAEDIPAWRQSIREKLKQISEIEYDLIVNNINVEFNLVSPVYAQSKQKPEWISNPPEDDFFLYFVGEARSGSLTTAERLSKENARESAVVYLVEQISGLKAFSQKEINHETLSEYLINSATVRRTFYEFDKSDQNFCYYTLIQLAKNLIEIDATFFALEKNIKVPNTKLISDNLQTIKSPRDSYYSQRALVYNNLLNQAQQVLTPEDYKLFEEARQTRKEGNSNKAMQVFKSILDRYPNFFMGWYNLALAYDALGDFELADAAYKKAIALEPAQTTRDASIYNTYGYFLVQQGNFVDSEKYFYSALEINPNHALANNNLKYVHYMMKK